MNYSSIRWSRIRTAYQGSGWTVSWSLISPSFGSRKPFTYAGSDLKYIFVAQLSSHPLSVNEKVFWHFYPPFFFLMRPTRVYGVRESLTMAQLIISCLLFALRSKPGSSWNWSAQTKGKHKKDLHQAITRFVDAAIREMSVSLVSRLLKILLLSKMQIMWW